MQYGNESGHIGKDVRNEPLKQVWKHIGQRA